MLRAAVILITLLLWFALPCSLAHAQCYRWTDDSGTEHFSDQVHLLSEKGRDGAVTWSCRTAATATADVVASPAKSKRGNRVTEEREATRVATKILDRSARGKQMRASRQEFLDHMERRIRIGYPVTTAQLLAYNRLKQSLASERSERQVP